MEITNRISIRRTAVGQSAVLLPILLSLLLVMAWLSLGKTAASSQSAYQNNLCVRPDGANGCYTTIQAAVDAAQNEDTITIAAATYNENVQISRTLEISGGWQPAGWPMTETIVLANGPDCAISLDSVSGSLNNLTVRGGTPAGICGTNIQSYTLAYITAENNSGDGVSMEVSAALTVSHSTLANNGKNGLVTSCQSGTDTRLTVADSIVRGNGRDGFNGGFAGSYCMVTAVYERNHSLENGLSGFDGFGGPCPARSEETGLNMVVKITDSVISDNNVGLKAYCGSLVTLERNVVQGNTMDGVMGLEAALFSVNNLYTDNGMNGVSVRAGLWNGMNDTIANNGMSELLLTDDRYIYPPQAAGFSESACDTPYVVLRNTIIWDNHLGIDWIPHPSCIPYIPGPFTVNINYSVVSGRELLVDEENIIYFTIGTAVHDGNPFYAGNGSYQLIAPSPAIDKGTAVGAPAIDIAGQPRPQDGDGNGTAEFDIGAYEAPPGFIWRTFSPLVR